MTSQPIYFVNRTFVQRFSPSKVHKIVYSDNMFTIHGATTNDARNSNNLGNEVGSIRLSDAEGMPAPRALPSGQGSRRCTVQVTGSLRRTPPCATTMRHHHHSVRSEAAQRRMQGVWEPSSNSFNGARSERDNESRQD